MKEVREILFRGKRADNGEWIEGYAVEYPSGKTEIHKKSIEPPDILLVCEVIPETICQYTGLTGKNGRRIFEGDIIKVTDCGVERGTGDVSLEDGAWYVSGELQERLHWLDDYIDYEFEVIGNIFDNPDLIV